MGEALTKSAARNIYRMDGNSAWIFADDADIWIIKGDSGLSISIWGPDKDADPIDAVFLTWDKTKGEVK